jgi:Zn-dependent peptidase ImmA (M78 family)/transcriptional regulator with XRE-family HTH domain
MSDFNPEMLVLARESRQMTQSQLALASNFSQGKISKYESGLLSVSEEDRRTLAKILQYPEGFFSQSDRIYGSGSPCFYHRKRKTAPVTILRSVHAKINIYRIAISRLLRGAEIEAAYQFPCLDIDEFNGDADEIARRVRASWNMPIGPVKSVIAAIEASGGVVVGFSFGTTKIDAVSQSLPNLPPFFFFNTDIEAGDRLRYTLSHELGHIVMKNSESPDSERQADRFAREFLMPAREIGRDLARLNIERAARLKPYWKTSMQALIGRAYELNAISKNAYHGLFAEVGRLGYRLREPVAVTPERPTIMQDIMRMYKNNFNYNNTEFEHLLCLHEGDYRAIATAAEQDRPNLRLVQ